MKIQAGKFTVELKNVVITEGSKLTVHEAETGKSETVDLYQEKIEENTREMAKMIKKLQKNREI